MKFSNFARSGERVSRIGFGAMVLGGSFGTYDEKYLIKSVLHSLDQGVTLIDTTRAYGESERNGQRLSLIQDKIVYRHTHPGSLLSLQKKR